MNRVLVVDDTPIDRLLVEGLLKQRKGTNVCTVSSGDAALQALETECCDLVVTDLTMPDMDGLQLTSAIRVRFPWVPVVIITAHGSEDLAIQALEQGATSYVPKTHLGTRLVDTVDHVLELARSSQAQQRFASAMVQADLKFQLENDVALFKPLIELVQQILSSLQFCDPAEELRILMALEEGLCHALYQGNLELSDEDVGRKTDHSNSSRGFLEARRLQPPYRDRQLFVDVHLSADEARFVVRHCGPALARQPSSITRPQLESERAFILMRTLLDEVSLDASGTVLTLVKRGQRPAGVGLDAGDEW
jgi:CheY-like chemotaxis protein